MKYFNSEPTQLSVSRIITKAFLAFLLSTLMLQTVQATTPTLVWNNSNFEQLIGAKNVSVDGWLYDVYFVEGTCDFLWAGCDDSKFLFKDPGSATAASQALLDQVFLDLAPHIMLDTVPRLIFGIESNVFGGIWTPYERIDLALVLVAQAQNFAPNKIWRPDEALSNTSKLSYIDTSIDPTGVWAKWSVPEPSTFALFAAGLAGLGFSRRHKKA